MCKKSWQDFSFRSLAFLRKTEAHQAKYLVRPWGLARSVVVRYPIPISSLFLLLLSGILWLARQSDLASLGLLVIIVLGSISLLWNIGQQMLQRHFGADYIALLALIGSFLLGEYLAGAIIVLMFSGGKALEEFALRRARRSLSALVERAPRTAHIWQKGDVIEIPVEQVKIGAMVVVRPGELIPVDGTIFSGEASISEMDLTGEPVPLMKTVGAPVLAGCVDLDGVLEIQATRASHESQYAQIIRLVQQAQEQKAPLHRLADRYSVIFTPIALVLAGLAWLLSGQAVFALAVLVVATPCPLILATPIAIMSGIDTAAHFSIILKSGGALEALGGVDTAIFDKTGTLTLGTPVVTRTILYPPPLTQKEQESSEDHLFRLAASLEQLSSHVLARAIVHEARSRGLELLMAHGVEEVFGKGIRGTIPSEDGREMVEVAVGHQTFMEHLAISLPPDLIRVREQQASEGRMGSFVAVDGKGIGYIVLEDIPREDLSQLAPRLKRAGIQDIIMLTGDNELVAQRIGQQAGVDRIIARCQPGEKAQIVQTYVNQKRRVLMIGDGVNDAPALATATIGMALGLHGFTAAASAADAVLLSPDILQVATAVDLGRHTMKIARQGIWLGMGLSIIAMICAAFGLIPPTVGALLQEVIDICVIINALRVRQFASRTDAGGQEENYHQEENLL